jgi:hypothetical protein
MEVLARRDPEDRRSPRPVRTDWIFNLTVLRMPVGVGGCKGFEATRVALGGPEHRGAGRASEMLVMARMLTRLT